MAVESRQHINMNNLFSSQANAQIETGVCFPVDYIQSPIQISESDLTYTFNHHHHHNQSTPISKRQRDSSTFDDSFASQKRRSIAFGSSSPELIYQQFQQQQTELDRFVNLQTETLRMELESRQRTQTRLLASAFETAVMKRLKAKDEEIARMGKLNWVLQERVKNLYVENQIWRDLAQTNEATANNLRSNLEQVLAQIDEFPNYNNASDDAESSCGSCEGGGDLTAGAEELTAVVNGGCRRCGERRASVLVLPCRHLCLCTVCGSALVEVCPVCDMVMNASVHVNMS